MPGLISCPVNFLGVVLLELHFFISIHIGKLVGLVPCDVMILGARGGLMKRSMLLGGLSFM